MARRSRRSDLPECEHEPRLMAHPGNPRWVSVECVRCGATTGYTTDPYEAWGHWEAGDVALPRELEEMGA